MAWVILVVAGIFEVVWAVGLKYSQGFTRPVASIITVAGMILSVLLLSQSTKSLPIGTAYAVWTGIGAVGAVILGMILFHEPRDLPRVFFLALIVVGIVGLKFFGGGE